MGGARVVPVRTHQNDDYYNQLFGRINGVLFPGGDVDILTSGYAKAAQKIYKLAIEANNKGDYFPLWGTCLGFELLTALRTGKNILSECDGENVLMPLSVEPGFKKSRMFRGMPDSTLHTLTTWNVTANFHHDCLTPETFQSSSAMSSFFNVLSINRDKKGKEFVSMMEAKNYPIYGSQWHPEKSVFTWDLRKNLNHSQGSIEVSQYFANFFVNEARKSMHHFPTVIEESQSLISNWHPVFDGEPSFENNYFFNYTKRPSKETIVQVVRVTVDSGDGSVHTVSGQVHVSLDFVRDTKSVLVLLAAMNCLAILFLLVSRRSKDKSVTLVQHIDRSDHKGAPHTTAYVDFPKTPML